MGEATMPTDPTYPSWDPCSHGCNGKPVCEVCTNRRYESALDRAREQIASLTSRLANVSAQRDEAAEAQRCAWSDNDRLRVNLREVCRERDGYAADVDKIDAELRAMTEERDAWKNLLDVEREHRDQLRNDYAAARAERDEAVRMMHRYREAGAAVDGALSREAAGALISPRAWIKTGYTAEPSIWYCSFCGEDYTTRPEAGFCTNTVHCRAAVRARVALDAWKARENVVERMNARLPPAEPRCCRIHTDAVCVSPGACRLDDPGAPCCAGDGAAPPAEPGSGTPPVNTVKEG
jgi:hypothetical protein